MSSKRPTRPTPERPNLWGMIRDITIAAINKGQFPMVIIAAMVVIVLLRMPKEDVSKLAFSALSFLASNQLMGWAVGTVGIFGWYFHVRYIRKLSSREFERIGREKKQLQEQSLNKRLPSSNQK